MAYGSRYKTTWYDFYGQLNEVYIREKDYAGSEETVQAMGSPISLELNEPDQDPYVSAIRGSVIRLNLKDITGFKYLEILTAPNKKYQMVWDIASARWWMGWSAPAEFQHPYNLAPYGVQLTATDALATLKDYYFDGTGKKSLMNILGICLSKIATGFQGTGSDPIIYLYENINKYESHHNKTVADSPLTQTYLDCDDVFYDEDGVAMNCYDVVNKVLFDFGVEFKMSDGAWCIVQENICGSAYTRRKYQMLGTATNYTYISNASYDPVLETTRGDVGITTMNTIPVGGNIRTLLALKSLKLTQDYGKRETSLLKNWELDKFTTDTQLENWTNTDGGHYSRIEKGIVFDLINPQYHSYGISQSIELEAASEQKILLRLKGYTMTNEEGDGLSSNEWSFNMNV